MGTVLLASGAAHAKGRDALVDLINAYRAAPGNCDGRPAKAAPPLAAHPALAGISIASGVLLDSALERAGYPVALAEAIHISGAPDAPAVLAVIAGKYCKSLLNPQFRAAGTSRNGANWLIVLAEPAKPIPVRQLPDTLQAQAVILAGVNAARAAPRTCGEQRFAPAPPLTWNATLAQAALEHSGDMADQSYFSHQGKDGRRVAERAAQAGYKWRLIGENIAVGQDSAEQAISGWLDSPGHCANIMRPDFTEVGAAFAVRAKGSPGRVYWTQVLAAPR